MSDFLGYSDEFAGQIIAQGLKMFTKDLDALDAEREIQIVRDDGWGAQAGDNAGRIYTITTDATHNKLYLIATNADDPDNAADIARLQIQYDSADPAQSHVDARVEGDEVRIIGDPDGSGGVTSSFPQLYSGGGRIGTNDRRIAWGTYTVTGNGTPTKVETENHGLGKVPVAVLTTGSAGLLGANTWTTVTRNYTSTQFDISVRHVDNLNWANDVFGAFVAFG